MYILQFLCTYYSSDVHTLFLFSYYIYKYFYFYCMLFYIFTTLLPYARGLQRKFHWLTCECPMIIKTLESWILNLTDCIWQPSLQLDKLLDKKHFQHKSPWNHQHFSVSMCAQTTKCTLSSEAWMCCCVSELSRAFFFLPQASRTS